MPELPEVETIRLQLDRVLPGLRVAGVEVLEPKSFVGEIREIKGRKVRGVNRKGKMLVVRLSARKARRVKNPKPDGPKYLLIHLKLTGQLIYQGRNGRNGEKEINGGERLLAAGKLANKFTRVIIGFDNGSKACVPAGKLYFNDLRKFGWMKLVGDLGEIGEMGVEPFSKEFTKDCLRQVFGRTSRPIKIVLMDQKKIAGVGNIYANEALFLAGIDPRTPAKELQEKGIKGLKGAVLKVLKAGIKYGGASDQYYLDALGKKGSYQDHFLVYGRAGKKCFECGGEIKRIKLGGRGTFYCPKCQT